MAGPKEPVPTKAGGRGAAAADGAMRVDTDMVRKLAELLTENNLTEIEVEDGDRFEIVHFVGGG